jgi:tetratricopeptide (TPR) repeat protein
MGIMVNYYEVLGLAQNVATGEIRKRIHEELRRWSVRANSPSPEKRQEADHMMRLLREMETVLLDEERRAEYDFQLHAHRGERGPARQTVNEESAGLTPEEMEKYLKEGRRLISEGDAKKAADALIRVSGSFGNHAEAWALLAEALHRAGRTKESVKPMVKARDLAPNKKEYALLLGEIFESLERHEQAEELYRLVASSGPDGNGGLFKLGRLYVKIGRIHEGIRLLEECLRVGGSDQAVKNELFRACLEVAMSSWKTVSPGHPVLPPGRYPMAKAEAEMAEESLRRAEALGVNDPALLARLEHMKEELRKKTGRKFAGSPVALAAMLAGLIIQMALYPAAWKWLWFLLPVLYVISALSPKYLIYRNGVQGESTRSDFARLFDWLRERFGAVAWLMMIPVYAVIAWFSKFVIIPVIIYNFYRHYLRGGAGA